MWKLALTGVWCVVVSLTAVYAASQFTPTAEEPKAQYPLFTEHEVVKSEMVTVPIIKQTKVDGYVVAEVSLTANDEAWHNSVGPSAELTDELISVLQSTPVLTDPMFAADSLRSELVNRMNARVGMQAYYNTLLTRLDYLTVNDLERMRKPGGNQMKSTPIVDQAALDVVPAPAKGK